MNRYTGQLKQVCGAEEFRLKNGWGKGMTLLRLYNGLGLDLTLSQDRCMDIVRLQFMGLNMGYLASCGVMPPMVYDDRDYGFVKTYSGGFLTTCGLSHMGPFDEEAPLHGRVSNTPCENWHRTETATELRIKAELRETAVFGEQLLLERTLCLSKTENRFTLKDVVTNIGSRPTPCGVLYNYNMGYPMLSAESVVTLPDTEAGGMVHCGIYNPVLGIEATLHFDADSLPYFTCYRQEERALGFEPANTPPVTRIEAREKGVLKELAPNESVVYETTWNFQKERVL